MSIIVSLFGFMLLIMVLLGVFFSIVVSKRIVDSTRNESFKNEDSLLYEESKRDKKRRMKSLENSGLISKDEYNSKNL